MIIVPNSSCQAKPNATIAGACIIVAGKRQGITKGLFTSVVVHHDQVYAAECRDNQTRVLQLAETSPPRWCQLRSIDHDFASKSQTLTLSISNNQLKCCSWAESTIKVYSLSGELLQTYGTPGRADAGQLRTPAISDDDDDGSVLIADCGNHRLQVMSEQGEFSVLQLQPRVSRPCSAVLFNNQLYVTSSILFDTGSLYKYSC